MITLEALTGRPFRLARPHAAAKRKEGRRPEWSDAADPPRATSGASRIRGGAALCRRREGTNVESNARKVIGHETIPLCNNKRIWRVVAVRFSFHNYRIHSRLLPLTIPCDNRENMGNLLHRLREWAKA